MPPPLPEPLGVAVADSHTHLDMQDGTVEQALEKAAAVGVTTVIQVGCDVKGSRWAAETAEAYAPVHAAVALHPNEAPGSSTATLMAGRARARAAPAATAPLTRPSPRSSGSRHCPG